MRDETQLPQAPSDPLFAAIVRDALDAIISKDIEGNVTSWNRSAERLFGWTANEMIGHSIRRIIPADRAEEEDVILSLIRSGEDVSKFETVRLHKDGHLLQVAVTVSPVKAKSGAVVGASKVANDISNDLHLRQRLETSERLFHILANSIPQLAWIADGEGSIFWYNDQWFKFTGTNINQMRGWGWTAVHHPDHVERVKARIQRSWDTAEEWEDTFPLRGADGSYRWFLSRAKPIFGHDGRVWRWFGTNTDVTAQMEHEEQMQMLTREISHRQKNLIAVIQALVSRTVDSHRAAELSARLQAISRNQDLLIQRSWTGVGLAELIRSQLATVEDMIDKRVFLNGDFNVVINATAAETLGWAIHEMATNAAKHGAMSNANGHIHIHWVIQDVAAEKHLIITWEESGGPEVNPPTKPGFGTIIIDKNPRAALGADIEVDYPPSGFVWRLSVSLKSVQVVKALPTDDG